MASRDIYVRHAYELKGKQVDARRVVHFGRITLLVLMAITLYVVMLKPAYITDYAYKLSSPFFAMIMPATVGGLFWKKGSKEGAWTGTVAGLIVVTIFTFFVKAPLGFSALIWGMAVNIILYVVVSLATKVPEEIGSKYIARIDSIISSGTEMHEIVNGTINAVKQ